RAEGSPAANLLLVLELHPEDLGRFVGGLHRVGVLPVFVFLLGLRDQLIGIFLLLRVLLLRRSVLELLDEQRTLLGERDTSTSTEHHHHGEQSHRLLHRVVTPPGLSWYSTLSIADPTLGFPGRLGPLGHGMKVIIDTLRELRGDLRYRRQLRDAGFSHATRSEERRVGKEHRP